MTSDASAMTAHAAETAVARNDQPFGGDVLQRISNLARARLLGLKVVAFESRPTLQWIVMSRAAGQVLVGAEVHLGAGVLVLVDALVEGDHRDAGVGGLLGHQRSGVQRQDQQAGTEVDAAAAAR